MIKIKPAHAGILLRDHKDKFKAVPAEGKMVVRDTTWARRLRDGDAVLVEEPKPVFKAPAVVEKTTKPQKSKDSK